MEKETIGDAVLYLGDCTEIIETLNPDLLLSDPPYGISLRGYDWNNKKVCMIGDSEPKKVLQVLKWAEEKRLPTVIFSSVYSLWPGNWRNILIWDKSGAVGGGGDTKKTWKRTFETIQIRHNKDLNGGRDNAILRHGIRQADLVNHPTEKPLSLMNYLVYKLSNPSDTVTDPFMGSGTTGVSCISSGRKFIGCEIERKYFDIACQRIENSHSQGDIFI